MLMKQVYHLVFLAKTPNRPKMLHIVMSAAKKFTKPFMFLNSKKAGSLNFFMFELVDFFTILVLIAAFFTIKGTPVIL